MKMKPTAGARHRVTARPWFRETLALGPAAAVCVLGLLSGGRGYWRGLLVDAWCTWVEVGGNGPSIAMLMMLVGFV